MLDTGSSESLVFNNGNAAAGGAGLTSLRERAARPAFSRPGGRRCYLLI